MTIRIICVSLGLCSLISACMSPYKPIATSPAHPASPEGEEAPVYHTSETLSSLQIKSDQKSKEVISDIAKDKALNTKHQQSPRKNHNASL